MVPDQLSIRLERQLPHKCRSLSSPLSLCPPPLSLSLCFSLARSLTFSSYNSISSDTECALLARINSIETFNYCSTGTFSIFTLAAYESPDQRRCYVIHYAFSRLRVNPLTALLLKGFFFFPNDRGIRMENEVGSVLIFLGNIIRIFGCYVTL